MNTGTATTRRRPIGQYNHTNVIANNPTNTIVGVDWIRSILGYFTTPSTTVHTAIGRPSRSLVKRVCWGMFIGMAVIWTGLMVVQPKVIEKIVKIDQAQADILKIFQGTYEVITSEEITRLDISISQIMELIDPVQSYTTLVDTKEKIKTKRDAEVLRLAAKFSAFHGEYCRDLQTKLGMMNKEECDWKSLQYYLESMIGRDDISDSDIEFFIALITYNTSHRDLKKYEAMKKDLPGILFWEDRLAIFEQIDKVKENIQKGITQTKEIKTLIKQIEHSIILDSIVRVFGKGMFTGFLRFIGIPSILAAFLSDLLTNLFIPLPSYIVACLYSQLAINYRFLQERVITVQFIEHTVSSGLTLKSYFWELLTGLGFCYFPHLLVIYLYTRTTPSVIPGADLIGNWVRSVIQSLIRDFHHVSFFLSVILEIPTSIPDVIGDIMHFLLISNTVGLITRCLLVNNRVFSKIFLFTTSQILYAFVHTVFNWETILGLIIVIIIMVFDKNLRTWNRFYFVTVFTTVGFVFTTFAGKSPFMSPSSIGVNWLVELNHWIMKSFYSPDALNVLANAN